MIASSTKSMHDIVSPSASASIYTATATGLASLVAAEVENIKLKPQPRSWLIVGLGNPDKRYDGTRHNVGFEMVDAIAEAEAISIKALFGKGFIGNVPAMLAKPQSFLNASGEFIFDDLDLPFAKLRLLPKGGLGGHNGMRSVINQFKGSRDFPRLRIGIGRPAGKIHPVNFVICPFNRQEREELDFAFQSGLEAVRILLLEGFDKSATFVSSAKSLDHLG